MANPAWFKFSEYMANKLASLQAADPDAGWTADSVAQAFSDAGFGGEEGAFNHFNQYGNSADENISPNNLFNAKQYYYFKAQQLQNYDSVSQVTEAEAAMVKAAIHDAGMSAWQHYIDYGTKEGVNPSNSFDTQKYLEAKAAALNAAKVDGKTDWDADSVADAFQKAGLNALEHAILYSKDDTAGEAAAVFDSTGAVVDAYKVDDKANTGDDDSQTYTLTTGQDNIVGTNGDDVIEAPRIDGLATLTAGDKIDGGAGTDTINVYAGTFDGVTMSNVEIVNDYVAKNNAFDTTTLNGVTNYNFLASTAGNVVTANVATQVGFTGSQGNMVVDFKNATGTSDAATIALNGVNASGDLAQGTAEDGTGATVETLTLNLSGTNYVGGGDIQAKAASGIELTGDGSLAKNADGDKVTIHTTASTLKSIDAGAATGDLSLTLGEKVNASFAYKGSAGKDNIDLSTGMGNAKDIAATVDLGAGDDKLTIAYDGMKAGSTFAGGDGKDTLTINVGTTDLDLTTADGVKPFSGFEALNLVTTAGHGTVDFDQTKMADVTAISVDATGADVTLSNLGASSTVTIKDASNIVTAKLANASAADSTLAITLDSGATSSAPAAGVTVAANKFVTNAHVLSVTSANTQSTSENSVALDEAALAGITNVKIAGDQDFILTMGAANSITLVDGSEAGGKLNIDLTGNTKAVEVTGSAQNDVITASDETGNKLAGNGGDDNFVMTGAVNTSGTPGDVVTTITDFTAGDIMTFANDLDSANEVKLGKSDNNDVKIFTALAADADTADAIYWASYNGNTYVHFSADANTGTQVGDIQIKLTGTLTFSNDGIDHAGITCDA